MQANKDHKKLGKEKLQRIIEMCIAIETHTVDPFTLNVDEIIKVVKEYFPDWEKADELNLDSEALHHLASVIKLQSEWVKQRSNALYTDPFLLEEKIKQTGKLQMVSFFLGVWHPIVEKEQLTLRSIAEGLRYWNALEPLGNRWKSIDVTEVACGSASRSEMVEQRVLSDVEFSEELDLVWQDLKAKTAQKGSEAISYWDFIDEDTYEQSVQKAYLTSFLVTYGYATLEIDRLEDTILIKPYQTQQNRVLTQQFTSTAIAVSFREWQKCKEAKNYEQ
jgi:hypothetical protein